jgi:hypothetical protein
VRVSCAHLALPHARARGDCDIISIAWAHLMGSARHSPVLDFGIAQIAGDVRALVAGLIITVSFVLLQVFEVKHTAATARHAPWCATGQAGPSRLPASSRSLACAVPPLAGWACVGW